MASSIYLNVQTIVPTTGQTITLPDSDAGNLLILANTATIAALTINAPPNPVNGQLMTILFAGAVTTLTMAGGTLKYNPGSANANSYVRYIYDFVNGVWMDAGHDVTNQIATVAALYRGKPFSVTTTSGSVVIYLTDTGLVGGNPLFSSIDYVHLDFVSNDPNFGKSYVLSGVTLTITAVKQSFSGVTVVGINVLGSVAIAAAANGTALTVLVQGKLN